MRHVKFTAVLMLLIPSFGAGQALRSVTFGTSQATYSVSDLTAGDMVAEFRIHNFAPPVSIDRDIFGVAEPFPIQFCRILANTLTLRCSFSNDGAPDGLTDFDLTGKTDVRVRYLRSGTDKTTVLSTWDGDCSSPQTHIKSIGTVAGQPFVTNGQTFGVGGQGLSLGFLRISTVVAPSTICPADVASAGYLSLLFDNNTFADTSGRNHHFSTNQATYTASPVYNPRAVISGLQTYKRVVRAGDPMTLTSQGSTTFSGNGVPVQYDWAQVAGPDEASLDSRNSPTVVIKPPVTGEYTFRLSVRDAEGRIGSVDQKIGVVASDSRGLVAIENQELAGVLGPLTRHGVNPWPWYDVAEAADADALEAAGMLNPLTGCCTSMAGTVTVTAAPPNTTEGTFICCTPVVTGTGTHFVSDLHVGDALFLWWDVGGDGSNRGRALVAVQQILDDTHFRIADYYWTRPLSLSSSMNYSKAGPDIAGYTYYGQPSTSWNYYDAILGLGRLWQRTGLEHYRDSFRLACEQWWVYGLDSGYASVIPRNAGWHAMAACAADNHPDWWEGLARNVARTVGNTPSPVTNGNNSFDSREIGFTTRATALLAKYYPAHAADATAARTLWCGHLSRLVNEIWIHNFVTLNGGRHGYWPEDLYSVDLNIPTGISEETGAFGTSPWRSNGIVNLALIRAHDAYTDAASCNNPTLADTLLDVIKKSAAFMYDYGRSPDGGLYYNVLYATNQGLAAGTVWRNNDTPGSIAVINGDTAIVGTSTTFPTSFSCDGSDRITILQSSGASADYQVAGCVDATHARLATAYVGPTGSGLSYSNAGRIAVTNGSTTVTGTATSFQPVFAPCDGTTYIGIPGQRDRWVYKVVGCPSNTSLTLEIPYRSSTESGIRLFTRGSKAPSNCAPSIAKSCEADLYDGRNLAHDPMASFAWLYFKTGESSWKDAAEYFGGRAYGGPAAGPGAIGPPFGPEADGHPNNFDDPLLACSQNGGIPPCGKGFGASVVLGKPFGMSAGIGDAPNAFAYLVGGPTRFANASLPVSINAPAVEGAAFARLTVTRPTRETAVTDCAALPCSVQVDRRLGTHVLAIDYLSPAGQVLRSVKFMVYGDRP